MSNIESKSLHNETAEEHNTEFRITRRDSLKHFRELQAKIMEELGDKYAEYKLVKNNITDVELVSQQLLRTYLKRRLTTEIITNVQPNSLDVLQILNDHFAYKVKDVIVALIKYGEAQYAKLMELIESSPSAKELIKVTEGYTSAMTQRFIINNSLSGAFADRSNSQTQQQGDK